MVDNSPSASLSKTPLHALHVGLGAKMAAFAGYDMPINYPQGILGEHLHTRAHAGLFDVSHMGQAILSGHNVGQNLERLAPADLLGLAPGRIRYTQLLDPDGNILDDFMATRLPSGNNGEEQFFLVVNAGTKAADFAHIEGNLPQLQLKILADRALLALQGPQAVEVLSRYLPEVADMAFMSMRLIVAQGMDFIVSRSGYTGEDGYEISVPAAQVEPFARSLLTEPEVKPVGLGARDSLRLEAGLCLYGHDIDTTTNPVEAGLVWSIGKRRREEGGFPGADRIRLQIAHGPPRRRVGLLPIGRAPAREGADVTTPQGEIIGRVTSGGFGPSFGGPIAMGYVLSAHAAVDTPVNLMVRAKPLAAKVVALPFVPHRYRRS